MAQLINFLRGNLTCSITAPFPERVLNLCALEGVLFWGLRWESQTSLTLTLPKTHLTQLTTIVQRLGGTINHQSAQGLPFFLARFRNRFAFLVGLTLAIFAVAVLSNFVLVIEVTGNERTSTAQILSSLEQSGLYLGVYGPSLSLTSLQQSAIIGLDDVAWLSINRTGTRIQVLVHETTKPPEIQSRDGVYDILSDVDGIIEQIQLHRGEPWVSVGDTVVKGQILVGGYTELPAPLYSELPSQWLPVHASATITARTWHTITAVTPLNPMLKTTQDHSKTSYQLHLFGKDFNILQNTSISPLGYDKIRTSTQPISSLPLAFSKITQQQITLTPATLNRESGQQLLQDCLLSAVQTKIGDVGEVITHEFVVKVVGDLLQVTLTAECIEQIGYTVPSAPMEGLAQE